MPTRAGSDLRPDGISCQRHWTSMRGNAHRESWRFNIWAGRTTCGSSCCWAAAVPVSL